ncbi:MAG: YchJ family metal-binding protein [Chloroflexota bacterium]
MNQACPCHSGKPYQACCQPYHDGKRPLLPLQLMRSRYAAYAMGKISYILKTEAGNIRSQNDKTKYRKDLKQYCQITSFIGLSILEAPTPTGHQGTVKFHAVMHQNGRDVSYTENSYFEKVKGQWIYVRAVESV